MIRCRACLKSQKNMIPFDEKYIRYFNILTNLNIKLSNDVPQHLCKSCYKTIQQFIDFRDKCISSNSVFSDIICIKNIKKEAEEEIKKISVEVEIKREESDNDEIFSCHEDIVTESHRDLSDTLNDDNDIPNKLVTKTREGEKKKGKGRKCENEGRTVNTKNKHVGTAKTNTLCEKKLESKDTCIESKQKARRRTDNSFEETNLNCGLCTESFDSKSEVDQHVLKHITDVICTICTEKFIDWQELLSHRLNHLPIHQRSCHLCPQKYRTAPYLEYHYRKDHSEGEKEKLTLRCKECGRSCNSPKKLQCHFKNCHDTKIFICDYCKKICPTKNHMRIHVLTHVDVKPYSCNLCDYTCKFSANLRTHKINRHNPKRVHCSQCLRVFRSKDELETHNCNKVGTICPVCGKVFTARKLLNRHLTSHDAVGRFKCERCPATFKWKAYLDVHLNKHDGIRNFECEFCDAKFYFRSVLIKHRRTHTGIKPYVCTVCQKGFTSNYNLKVHMRVHGEYLINKKYFNKPISK